MFNEFKDVDASVLFRDVKRQHRNRIFAEQRPPSDVGQLEGVSLQVDVRNSRPLIRLQTLDLQSRRKLGNAVLAGVQQNGRRQGQRRGRAAQFKLLETMF